MPTNEITLKLKISDDGTLRLVTTAAKKTTKAVDKLATSTDNLNKKRNAYSKREKGVAGLTSNSTKSFAKQVQTLGGGGGLVAAYATLAANIFAITAAFGALKQAAALDQLTAGLIHVGNAAGANLPFVAEGLREITGAAISTQEAMTAVALGTSAGFSTTQLEGLTKVAKGASLALGRDMGDAMNRLTRGAAKLEPEILDELGIMVRLDDATENYAATIGKTAAQLTQFERRMAFTNAIIEQGEKKFGAIADSIDASPFDKLSGTFADLTKDILKVINVAFKPLAKFFSENKGALLGGMILFATTISRQMLPALANTAKTASKAADELADMSKAQLDGLKATSKGVAVYNQLLPKLKDGTATIKEQKQALDSLTKSERLHRVQLESMAKTTTADIVKFEQKKQLLGQVTRAKLALIAANKAETLSNAALIKAEALRSTQQFKFIAGAKLMLLATAEQISAHNIESIAITGKITLLTRLKSAYIAGGAAAKFMGTAMLTLIPIIGTIVLIVSSLLPLLGDLFKKSKIILAAEDAASSFESFNRIAEQLGDTIQKSSDVNEVYTAKLRVNVGVMDQVITGLGAIRKAQQEDQTNRLTEAYSDLSAATRAYNAIPFGDIENAAALERIAVAREKITAVISEQGIINKVAAKIALDAALAQARASGVLTKSLEGSIAEISQQVELGIIKKWPALNRALETSVKESKLLLGNLDGIESLTSAMSKSLIDLTKKGGGPYQGLIGSLKEMQNATVTAFNAGEDAFVAYRDKVKETNKGLFELLSTIGKGSFALGLGSAIESMEKYQELAKTTKNIVAGHVIEANKLKSTMSLVADSARKFFKESNAAVQAQIDLAEADLKVKDSLKISEQDRLALTLKITNLKAKLVSDSFIELKASQAILNSQKMLFSVTSKLATSSKTLVNNQIEMTRQKKLQSILKDPTRKEKELTAKEEQQLFEDNKKARLDLISLETDLKLSSINLEFDLLKLKFEFLKAQAATTGVELPVGFAEEYTATITQAHIEATNAAISNEKLAREKLATEGAEKKEATAKSIVARSAKGDTAFERTGFTDEVIGDFDRLKTAGEGLKVIQNVITPIKDSLRELGPEGELVAAVAQGALVIADSWNTVGEVFSTTSTKMEKAGAILNAVGQTISQVGSVMAASSNAEIAGVDNAIAAEKKRDGKSKESLSRIKAMEAKKEKLARKAFETNKKMQMGAAVANTAAAVVGALGSQPFGPWNIALAAIVGAMGAAQLAVISGTSFQGGGAASAGGPTKVSMGDRSNSVNLARGINPAGEQAFIRGERGIGTSATDFTPAFTGVKHRATGGATTGFVVGEQGPELFMPETPGVIKPADETANGLGTSVNATFNINAIDASGVEELLTVQRGNIIKMIREAANQHGEFFLEDVREESLT